MGTMCSPPKSKPNEKVGEHFDGNKRQYFDSNSFKANIVVPVEKLRLLKKRLKRKRRMYVEFCFLLFDFVA